MLADNPLIGFIPTTDAARAHIFFVERLGLRFEYDDGFALVVSTAGSQIRIVRVGEFTPVPYTILGWEVPDLAGSVREIAASGVVFTRYPHVTQDELGIWTTPSGSQVAWFSDPDGNVLSLSQHSTRPVPA